MTSSGWNIGEGGAVAIAEPVQIFGVADAVGQVDIQAGWRLLGGIVVELVDGEREHRLVAGEDRGGAVAVVDVAIHHHGAADRAVALQAADRHGDIVDGAESLAVAGEGVVKAAADVEADAVLRAPAARPAMVPPAASQNASTICRE